VKWAKGTGCQEVRENDELNKGVSHGKALRKKGEKNLRNGHCETENDRQEARQLTLLTKISSKAG